MEADPWIIRDDKPLREILTDIYNRGYTSLLVEGGRQVLEMFIREGLWDIIRIETGAVAFGEFGTVKAPHFSGYEPVSNITIEGQTIKYYNYSPILSVKNI